MLAFGVELMTVSTDKSILKLCDSSLTKVILYDDYKYSDIQNHDVLK